MSNPIVPVTWSAPTAILIELPVEFTGPRVLVRPYRAGDGAVMWDAVEESREHLEPWLPWGPAYKCPEDCEGFVRRKYAQWITREDLSMSVWERETGRFLGGIGLHKIDWNVPSMEIGYWIRKSAEGRGYMTEAARLVTTAAFENLNANRVFIRCGAPNLRSVAIPKRLGYSFEGRLRNHLRNTRGELYDVEIYSMIPEDYEFAPFRRP